MARTKKTVRYDGRVAGIKVTVDTDRYGVAAKAKKKIIDAAWKKVDAAAKAAAVASTEYGRALIATDPRRVDTGYMRDAFRVDASKGGKVGIVGTVLSRTMRGRRMVRTASALLVICALVCVVSLRAATRGRVLPRLSICLV